MHLRLESIALNSLKIKKNKMGRGNRSRCVYYNESFYYKVWDCNYLRINQFEMAIDSGFIDSHISPGFVSIIKDKNMITRGYVYKRCKRNYEDISFYKDYFLDLKDKVKKTGIFYYDLAPCNIVLYNKKPSLIDLESFWEIKGFKSLEEPIKPAHYRSFIEREYKIWLKNINNLNKRAGMI